MFQFWSLSIEEQFYLFCPLIFVVGMRCLRASSGPGLIFAVLGVASSVYMYLSSRSGHWLLVYFSTATRVGEILAGVVLAFVVTTVWFRRCETRRLVPTAGPVRRSRRAWSGSASSGTSQGSRGRRSTAQ